jgi:PPOX class probable F420-dependent enzyme
MLTPEEADRFLAEHHKGVLATLKSDGRPQLSNIVYAVLDGRVRVSVTADRAKTRNLRRDPRVSLHVTTDDFWPYLVVEGHAELSPVAAEPGDGVCQRLLALHDAVQPQPHPDPDEFHAAMIAEQRLELSFAVTHRYPLAG